MRPNLARVRASGANIIIVDVDKNLIKPFLFQVGFLFTFSMREMFVIHV